MLSLASTPTEYRAKQGKRLIDYPVGKPAYDKKLIREGKKQEIN
jgi:hypothetical protein